MKRAATWLLLVVGVGLIIAPFAFNMWVPAPRGAEMISDFSTIMTRQQASLYNDNYLPTISLGFGNVPSAMGAAAVHYGNGATLDYQQAAQFLQDHPALRDLGYVQQNFPTMAAPFTNMIGIMVRDADAYQGVAGLPPFWLFPFFFVIPGVILVAVAVVLLRRQRRGVTGSRAPVWVATVLGLGLAAAPFLPMPPGWGLMWRVAPPGAQMIADFHGPASGVPGDAPVMSQATVALFNGYIGRLQAARAEIIPAVQMVAARYGRSIGGDEAARFIRADPRLAKLSVIVDQFPTMYSSFHHMLGIMQRDVADYEAVRALPPFNLFPYFFLLPGLLAAAAGIVLLRRTPGGAATSVIEPLSRTARVA